MDEQSSRVAARPSDSDRPPEVLIACADPLVGASLRAILEERHRYGTAVAPRDKDLPQAVLGHDPAILVLDEDHTNLDCVHLVVVLRDAGYPGKILLLSPALGPVHLRAAIRAGADGYLTRSAVGDRLVPSVGAMLEGHYAISPDLAAQALKADPCPLSSREVTMLSLVAQHLPTEQIAGSLGLTPGMTRNLISSAVKKLGAHTRDEAAARASARGWV